MYDKATADGRFVQRVAHLFCEVGSALRQDLEVMRQTGERSPDLDKELRAYAMCCIDDTIGESPHRDISHMIARNFGSKVRYNAASLRFRDNMRSWSSMRAEPNLRESLWRSWMIVVPRSALNMERKHTKSKHADVREAVWDFVYRAGPHAFTDWSCLSESFADLGRRQDLQWPKTAMAQNRNLVRA